MIKRYSLNIIYIAFCSLFAIPALSQIPSLPPIINENSQPSQENKSNIDVEMLGLDNIDDSNPSSAEKELSKKSYLPALPKVIDKKAEVDNGQQKTEKKASKNSVQAKSANLENKKDDGDDKNGGGIISKIKDFVERSSGDKKVLNLKLGPEAKEEKAKEKTAEEIAKEKEREKKRQILAKQKKERLERLKKQFLLKVDDQNTSNFIVPRKKQLSWSDRFYVTKDMAPPLISRSREDENSHIPIIPTFKERIASLFTTVRSNDINAFNNMYRKIAIPDIRNSRGETILTYAILLKRHPVISSILAKGADPDLPNSLGHTPLDIAIENMDLKSVKILIDNHADIDYSDKYNRTFLMLAARRGYLPVVRLLVENGANVNRYDSFGRTALSIALRHKKEIIAKYLLKNGALTWIEKPMDESNQQFILELKNRWNNSINIPQ